MAKGPRASRAEKGPPRNVLVDDSGSSGEEGTPATGAQRERGARPPRDPAARQTDQHDGSAPVRDASKLATVMKLTSAVLMRPRELDSSAGTTSCVPFVALASFVQLAMRVKVGQQVLSRELKRSTDFDYTDDFTSEKGSAPKMMVGQQRVASADVAGDLTHAARVLSTITPEERTLLVDVVAQAADAGKVVVRANGGDGAVSADLLESSRAEIRALLRNNVGPTVSAVQCTRRARRGSRAAAKAEAGEDGAGGGGAHLKAGAGPAPPTKVEKLNRAAEKMTAQLRAEWATLPAGDRRGEHQTFERFMAMRIGSDQKVWKAYQHLAEERLARCFPNFAPEPPGRPPAAPPPP